MQVHRLKSYSLEKTGRQIGHVSQRVVESQFLNNIGEEYYSK